MFSNAVYVSSLTCEQWAKGKEEGKFTKSRSRELRIKICRNKELSPSPLHQSGRSSLTQRWEAQSLVVSFDILGRETVLVHTAILERQSHLKFKKAIE